MYRILFHSQKPLNNAGVDINENKDEASVQSRMAVASIGNFDGFHLGHQQLLEQVRQIGNAANYRRVVITFEPSSIDYFNDCNQHVRQSRLGLLRDFPIERIARRYRLIATTTVSASAITQRIFIAIRRATSSPVFSSATIAAGLKSLPFP